MHPPPQSRTMTTRAGAGPNIFIKARKALDASWGWWWWLYIVFSFVDTLPHFEISLFYVVCSPRCLMCIAARRGAGGCICSMVHPLIFRLYTASGRYVVGCKTKRINGVADNEAFAAENPGRANSSAVHCLRCIFFCYLNYIHNILLRMF